jgi:hypothetical protein
VAWGLLGRGLLGGEAFGSEGQDLGHVDFEHARAAECIRESNRA